MLTPERLYPITSDRHPSLSHSDQIDLCLDLGIRFVQLRIKSGTDRKRFREIRLASRLCQDRKAHLIVNDRLDFALAADAAGLHLGQEDLPSSVARRLLPKGKLLGISTHNREQFEEAQSLPVNYVAVGPIWSTSTKKSSHAPIGPEDLEAWLPYSRLPTVAIGGVTLDRARRLWDVGIHSVAVVSDIFEREDPRARLDAYLEAVRGG